MKINIWVMGEAAVPYAITKTVLFGEDLLRDR